MIGKLSKAMLALSGVTGLVCCATFFGQKEKQLSTDQEILDYYLNVPSSFVSFSPDGASTLYKRKTNSGFELFTKAFPEGSFNLINSLPDTQLSLTWKPDGHEMLFQAGDGGRKPFFLNLLNLTTKNLVRIDAPPSMSAAPRIRWRPGREEIAYIVSNNGIANLLTVSTNPAMTGGKVQTVLSAMEIQADFDWSPDGKMIAGNQIATPGSITIVNVDSMKTQTVEIEKTGVIRHLVWSPNNVDLLLTVRGTNDEFFRLVHLNTKTKLVKNILTLSGNIQRPIYSPDGKRVSIQLEQVKNISVILVDEVFRILHTWSADWGSYEASFFSKDGKQIFATKRAFDKPAYPIVLNTSGSFLESDSSESNAASSISAPALASVKASGVGIPVFLWTSKSNSIGKKSVLLQIWGGPTPRAKTEWDLGRQVLLKKGVSVAAINLSGASGFSKKFEQTSSSLLIHAEQVVSVADYLRKQGFQQILVTGTSYGADVALNAATVKNSRLDGVFLLATPPHSMPNKSVVDKSTLAPIFAYHGLEDEIANLSTAKSIFESYDAGVKFISFDREGHMFHRATSQSKIMADIISFAESR